MACKKCGECCRYIAYIYSNNGLLPTEQDLVWAEGRGIKFRTEGLLVIGFAPCKCKYLDEEKNECKIYNVRPHACRIMPLKGLMHMHPESCKFFDEEVKRPKVVALRPVRKKDEDGNPDGLQG